MPLPDIRDLSLEELEVYLKSMAAEPFRAVQIFQWIYKRGAWGFDAMTNIPQELRDRLKKSFSLKPNEIAQKVISEDGTTKFLFDLQDHEKIETVLIPTPKPGPPLVFQPRRVASLAVNSVPAVLAAGSRNLTCAEIVTQVLHIREEALKHKRPLTNIVFMGTGEPLDNFVQLDESRSPY